jgi:hypothetical protein
LLCGSNHGRGGSVSPTLLRICGGVTLLDANVCMANQMREFVVVDHVNKFTRKAPLLWVSESLGVNIGSHGGRILIEKVKRALCKRIVKICDANTMGAVQMAHGRIATIFADLYHGLVILVKLNHVAFSKQSVP